MKKLTACIAVSISGLAGCIAPVDEEELEYEEVQSDADALTSPNISGCLTQPGSAYNSQTKRFSVHTGSYDSGLGSLNPNKSTVLIAGRSVDAALVAELRNQDSSRNYVFLYCENMAAHQLVRSMMWMEQQIGWRPDVTMLGIDAASFCDTPRRFYDVEVAIEQTVYAMNARGWRNLVVEMYPTIPHPFYDRHLNRWSHFSPSHYACYGNGTLSAWTAEASAYNQNFRSLGWMVGDLWNAEGYFVIDGTHPHSYSVHHAAKNARGGLDALGW